MTSSSSATLFQNLVTCDSLTRLPDIIAAPKSAFTAPLSSAQVIEYRDERFVLHHLPRLVYADPRVEEDYMVFCYKDQTTPAVMVGIITASSLASLIVSVPYRSSTTSMAFAILAFSVWFIACATLLITLRKSKSFDSRFRLFQTSTEPSGEGRSDAVSGRDRQNDMGAVTFALMYLGFDLTSLVSSFSSHEDLRKIISDVYSNVSHHEGGLILANIAMYLGSLSFALSKVDCPINVADISTFCVNTIQLDGIIAVAFVLSICICRLRSCIQAPLTVVCVVAFFVIRLSLNFNLGNPSPTYSKALVAAVLPPATMSIVIGWIVDKFERDFFVDQHMLIEKREESKRLANYAASVANSMIPGSVALRLARGERVHDVVEDAVVVCVCIRRFSSLPLRHGASPEDIVHLLQSFNICLDTVTSSTENLCPFHSFQRSAVRKFHSCGDEYLLVCSQRFASSGLGRDEAACGADLTRREVKRNFAVAMWVLLTALEEMARDRRERMKKTAALESLLRLLRPPPASTSSLLQTSSSRNAEPIVQINCSVTVGEVCCASVGSLRRSYVALGPAVDRARNIARLVPPAMGVTDSIRDENVSGVFRSSVGNEFPQIRLEQECLLLLRHSHCLHFDDSLFQTSQSLVHCGKWLSKINSPHSAGNPFDNSLTTDLVELLHCRSVAGKIDLSCFQPNTLALHTEESRGSAFSTLDFPSSNIAETYSGIAASSNSLSACRVPSSRGEEKATVAANPMVLPQPTTDPERPVSDRGQASVENQQGGDHEMFRTTTRYLLLPVFCNEAVELRYIEHVSSADESSRTLLEFVTAAVVGLSLVIICRLYSISCFDYRSPLLWATVALVVPVAIVAWMATVAVLRGIVSTTGSAGLTQLPIWATRGAELLFAVSYVATFVVSDVTTALGSGQVFWAGIIFEIVALRERRIGLLFHLVADGVLTIPFVLMLWYRFPAGTMRTALVFVLLLFSVAMMAVHALLDKFRRERFAASDEARLLQEKFQLDAQSLEIMMDRMIPNTIAGKLMNDVRGKQLGTAAQSYTLFGLTKNHRQRKRGISPSDAFATAVEDMPLMMVHMRRVRRESATTVLSRDAAVLERVFALLDTVLEQCNTVTFVKSDGCFAQLVDDRNCDNPTEQAISLATVAIQFVRAFEESAGCHGDSTRLCDEVDVSIVLGCGPVVGAVLGNSTLCFEFHGDVTNLMRNLSAEAHPYRVLATTRFANLVELGLRGSHELLPALHPKVMSDPLGEQQPLESDEVGLPLKWDKSVNVSPPFAYAVRGHGKVFLHSVGTNKCE